MGGLSSSARGWEAEGLRRTSVGQIRQETVKKLSCLPLAPSLTPRRPPPAPTCVSFLVGECMSAPRSFFAVCGERPSASPKTAPSLRQAPPGSGHGGRIVTSGASSRTCPRGAPGARPTRGGSHTHHALLRLDEGPAQAVHLAVEAAGVAQVVAGAVPPPQRRLDGAAVHALAALGQVLQQVCGGEWRRKWPVRRRRAQGGTPQPGAPA